jgi:hypothetical protein
MVSLSFAVLIPLFLLSASTVIGKRFKFQVNTVTLLLSLLFLGYWVILIRPMLAGQVGGTFKEKYAPEEYIQLKNTLQNDQSFFRTLWVPRQHRFTLSTPQHPAVEAHHLFSAKNNRDLVRKLSTTEGKRRIEELGIKYIIIPYDLYGEIFIADRKYSEKERDYIEQSLDAIPWLKKTSDGNLTLYEAPTHSDHFSLLGKGEISYFRKSPHHYRVVMDIKEPSVINFAESYHPLWLGELENKKIKPQQTPLGTQAYPIEKKGMYVMDIIFTGHTIYTVGKIISGVAIFLLVSYFIMLKLKKL